MTGERDAIKRAEVLRLADRVGFHRSRILSARDTDGGGPGASYLLCALSCYDGLPQDGSTPESPHGLIAPFARKNYYQESVSRLRRVFSEVRRRTGLRKSDGRIFCNSHLPEKSMAVRCGLGFYGRNSLVIAPGLGSLFVISGLRLPFDWSSDPPVIPDLAAGALCGDCRACIEACPTGAISDHGAIDRETCLQALSTSISALPPAIREIWGYRIYGCQVCQDVCPYNRGLRRRTRTSRGLLGPSVPLTRILSLAEDELAGALAGSVLDRRWIPKAAILRNALLAAGHRHDPRLLQWIDGHLDSADAAVAEAAAWAHERLSAPDA